MSYLVPMSTMGERPLVSVDPPFALLIFGPMITTRFSILWRRRWLR
jgi:hypothetical protein